jgi:hypothetical protein
MNRQAIDKWDVAREVPAVAGYLAGVAWIVTHWAALPEKVPIHFGLFGHPDGWAPRGAIWLVPAVATFLYMSLTLGQYFGKPNVPWKITPENRANIYRLTKNLIWWLKLQTTWMIAYVEYAQVQVAMGVQEGLGSWFAPAFLGMIFFTLSLYFYIGHRAALGR